MAGDARHRPARHRPVVALELLASARDEQAFGDLDQALAALAQAPITRADTGPLPFPLRV
jgi:hypothetical protein